GPLPVTIASYEQVLRDNFVLLRASERMSRIKEAVGSSDDALVKTLVYLAEFPTPIHGSFDASYLELPEEILSTVMRHHQRYFSVLNAAGSLAPEFIAIANTDGDPDGLIRQGHERVLRARFNDARFFWNIDQQKNLSARLPDLAKVTFHAKLGSYKDKTERVVRLAAELAAQTGADENAVARAALLSKCDLTTDMVKEFPELQGIVGGLYAREQGESEAIAAAIYDHYKPVGMEDSIPRTLNGQVLSIADKLDTLRECFRIDLVPTGSKDPFALRRAAQGIVKILFEAELQIDVLHISQPELKTFLLERISFYLREVGGFPYDEVNAVMATSSRTVIDFLDRIKALHHVRPTDDFISIAAGFKRIKNILIQAKFFGHAPVKLELLTNGPEKQLYEAALAVSKAFETAAGYKHQLELIASLRPQVDLFFDKILVNDPDPEIRQNRLALLSNLLAEFSTIADFSEIVTQG
ncbi:MAG: glycine--tRNA ligase subunit beta, partial [Bryobacteraceae bacterium]